MDMILTKPIHFSYF